MTMPMAAWVQTGFGGPECRVLREVPRPVPQPDEVLVQVAACALNRLDLLQLSKPVVQPFTLPHIAGMDIAGTVVQAGGPAGEALLGCEVVIDPVVTCDAPDPCDMCRADLPMYCRHLRTIGSTRPGGLAEYVAVPARNCMPATPRATNLADLACVPVAAVTAYHALVTVGRMQPGEVVVIPGAGSGLGSFGIRLARAAGCRVVTLVGDATKHTPAAALGADVVIDRSAQDWVAHTLAYTEGRGADLVWDHVGGPFLQQAIVASRIAGRVVLSGTTAADSSTIHNASLFHYGRTLLGHGGYSRAEMHHVVGAALAGTLATTIDSRWNFADLPQAEARLASGAFFGKLLVCLT